jgi:hypothetical protein
MGRQGALAHYLAQMLSLVNGNLDRTGGNVLPARGVLPMVLPAEVSAPRTTRWGDYRPARGTPPGPLMAGMILEEDEPIPAVVVVAGRPVLSIGGGPRPYRFSTKVGAELALRISASPLPAPDTMGDRPFGDLRVAHLREARAEARHQPLSVGPAKLFGS